MHSKALTSPQRELSPHVTGTHQTGLYESGPRKEVLFHLLGDARKASSRVRGYWIAEELQMLGHDVSFHSSQRRMDYWSLFKKGLRVDTIVFQKRYSRYDVAIARILGRLGKTVLFDIDDRPSNTGNPVTERNASRMMRAADHVLAGSRNLQLLVDDAGGDSVFVPSGIRLEHYPCKSSAHGPVCLGWIGNGAHYLEDLISVLDAPLRAVAAQTPIKLKIVGACGQEKLREVFGAIDGIDLELIDQIDWSTPKAVSDAVAEFDIGLYPLLETPFNRYKCAFKALEYMATGLPVIASAVGANSDVVSDGQDGLLVQSDADWTEALLRLINDASLRESMGVAGREKVKSHYSTQALARKISELL